jgi:VanZ family protein
MLLGIYLSLRPTSADAPVIPHLDKLIHAGSYALLAIFAVCIFEEIDTRRKALFWLVLFGGLIELAQGFLPTGRMMEFADFIANSAGIGLGALLARQFNLLLWIEKKYQSMLQP